MSLFVKVAESLALAAPVALVITALIKGIGTLQSIYLHRAERRASSRMHGSS